MKEYLEIIPILLHTVLILISIIYATKLFKFRLDYKVVKSKLQRSKKQLEILYYIRENGYNHIGNNTDPNFPHREKFEPSDLKTELNTIDEFINNLPN
ncbi:MAG: hypothetical protein H8E84_08320 [Flavobacteriales bacterium]|nr:hypothetical protein [Flavobacteriales bacterium]